MNERILERIARYGRKSDELSARADCLRKWALEESEGSDDIYDAILKEKGFEEMSETSTVWNVRKFVLELGFDMAHGVSERMIDFFEERILYNFARLKDFDESDFGRLKFKYAMAEIQECNEAIAILSSSNGENRTDWEKISQLSNTERGKILFSKDKRRLAALMIIEAERDALKGVFSQVWIDARDGEIWTTHFSQGETYLPTDESRNYICLWRAEETPSEKDIEAMKSKPLHDPKYSDDEFESCAEKFLEENFPYIKWY